MRAIVYALILMLSVSNARADEEYELFRVTCSNILPSFQVEPYTYWNIGHLIWPKRGDWSSHVAALLKLESEASLYVFGDLYGHYDGSELRWKCGSIEVVATFDKLERENPMGKAYPPVYVRTFPRISVWHGSKKIVSSLPIAPYSFRTYVDYTGEPYIAICSRDRKCKDDLATNWIPLTRESVDARLASSDL